MKIRFFSSWKDAKNALSNVALNTVIVIFKIKEKVAFCWI